MILRPTWLRAGAAIRIPSGRPEVQLEMLRAMRTRAVDSVHKRVVQLRADPRRMGTLESLGADVERVTAFGVSLKLAGGGKARSAFLGFDEAGKLKAYVWDGKARRELTDDLLHLSTVPRIEEAMGPVFRLADDFTDQVHRRRVERVVQEFLGQPTGTRQVAASHKRR